MHVNSLDAIVSITKVTQARYYVLVIVQLLVDTAGDDPHVWVLPVSYTHLTLPTIYSV